MRYIGSFRSGNMVEIPPHSAENIRSDIIKSILGCYLQDWNSSMGESKVSTALMARGRDQYPCWLRGAPFNCGCKEAEHFITIGVLQFIQRVNYDIDWTWKMLEKVGQHPLNIDQGRIFSDSAEFVFIGSATL